LSPQAVRASSGGDSGGLDIQPPAPIEWKSLSIDQLAEEVKDATDPKAPYIEGIATAATGGLGYFMTLARQRHLKDTKEEVERRLVNPDLPIYEKEYLENLLEVLNNPPKSLTGQAIDKIKGVEQPDLPNLSGPKYDMLPDSYGISEPYTPDPQEESDKKIPNVDPELAAPYVPQVPTTFSDETIEAAKKISQEAAAKSFSTPGETRKPDDADDFIAAVKKDPTSFLPPTPSRSRDDGPSLAEKMSKAAQDRQKQANKFTASKIADYRSGKKVSGFDKGGLMKKKKTNNKKSNNKKSNNKKSK